MAAKETVTQTEQAAAEFFTKHGNRQFPPMLSRQEKLDLVSEAIPFHIMSVRSYDHKQYGPSWVLDLDFGDDDIKSLFLSRDDQRDQFFTNLQVFLVSNPYLPAKLSQVMTNSGQDYFVIEPV